MPEVGEVRKDYEVGKGNKRDNLVWLSCLTCGVERWVKVSDTRKTNFTGLCIKCILLKRNGKLQNSPNWKGGIKHCGGRVFVWLPIEHRYRCMADKLGYIHRARLTMAGHLNRPLESCEDVHHEDEIRGHDDIENLILFRSKGEHQRYHRLKEIRIKGLRPINGLGQYIKGGYLCHQ